MKRNRVIFLVAAGIFLLSLVKIGWEIYGYVRAAGEYDGIRIYRMEKDPDSGETDEGQQDDGSNEKKLDTESLRAINGDFAGWIQIPGTNIDYPVVQGSDNEKYLTTTFQNTKNKCGAIFIDSRCPKAFGGLVTILYGHNMKDGSMFHDLNRYMEQDYYEAHSQVWIAQGGEWKSYKMFSLHVTEADSGTYQVVFADHDDYRTYLLRESALSLYDTGYQADTEKSTVVLSTCYGQQRFVALLQEE